MRSFPLRRRGRAGNMALARGSPPLPRAAGDV